MSYRAKVLVSITASVIVAVWLVAALISARVTRTFEQRESERAAAAVKLFRREFDRRGTEISARVASIAASEAVSRIGAPGADTYQYVNEAETLAHEHRLELLTIAGSSGTIISSAHWPARFGYKEDWLTQTADWNTTSFFLRRFELSDSSVLGLVAVRTLRSGDGLLYVAGGMRLDQGFLESLPAFQGMQVSLMPEHPRPEATTDVVTDIPLTARDGSVLATLRATQSRAELFELRRSVRNTAVGVGAASVGVGLLLGFWAASRVTRPVRELASTVRSVATGDWNARASVTSHDEIGQLALDFNQMTEQLVSQQNRMLQAERVAAWRELARRLAHELKNPLFPLQITVENLRRARSAAPADFDEIFDESTSTLLAELNNLKTIIGRFGDFARMPGPQFESLDVNELVRDSMRLFEAQAAEPGRPPVGTRLDLAPSLPRAQADPDQLRRALRNLALNALDAMPDGGTLTIRTFQQNARVTIEIEDTGSGLTPEEQERLFTPYYTTKQHGTGLGLAIVQSVVSDHHGTISVKSAPDRGTTFRLELPHEQTAVSG